MSTSDLLTVQVPNSVDAGLFDDPSNATLMVNSVIGDFECAFGSFVMGEGIATDELHDATLDNRNWNLDRRDNGFTSGFYGVNSCATTTGDEWTIRFGPLILGAYSANLFAFTEHLRWSPDTR